VSELQNEGRECILITSGAVAFGKQKLAQEVMMSMSMRETIQQGNTKEDINALMNKSLKKPNAAVGQSGLQALYETMFRNYGILVGQVLVTKADFYNTHTREQLFTTIDELLQLNIIPIINTNDAVSPPPDKTEDVDGILGIKDNDSLAARVAVETKADLAILMSDVDGIYDKPPAYDNSRVMYTFNPCDLNLVKYGEKSAAGTGGMESKVKSALWALENGSSVVICNGMKYNTIRKIMAGQKLGSFFTQAEPDVMPVEILAKSARKGSRRLQSLSPTERAQIITTIGDSLIRRSDEILKVNQLDLDKASREGLTGPMYSRLAMTHQKIVSLTDGLRQIADTSHNNVGKILRRTKLSDTMELTQKTVPIGVLMVIFESRPDCLPQVAALAIASANGLLMKGGKEATNTNALLMSIVKEGLGAYGCADSISLVIYINLRISEFA
jgi:delta-1-pyrroline-5-carboxylate synthetase